MRAARHIILAALVWLTATWAAAASAATGGDSIPFAIDLASAEGLQASYDSQSGEYTLTTTGGDPYILTRRLGEDLPANAGVLTFEYHCADGIGDFQVFFCDPIIEYRATSTLKIPATIGTEWASFRLPIKHYRDKLDWGKAGNRLRFDIGSSSGVVFQIRNIRIVAMTEAESLAQRKTDSIRAAGKRMAANLEAYLGANYASRVTSVSVGRDGVKVCGVCAGRGSFALADIAPYEDITETAHFESLAPIARGGKFTLTLPRTVVRQGVSYDRALSKWAIVKLGGGKTTLDSHARYADKVFALFSAKPAKFKGKKGIAAGGGATYIADFDSLPAHSITQNIMLDSYFSPTRSDRFPEPFSYGGREYYVSSRAIERLGNLLSEADKRGIVVEAIILTRRGTAYEDPECDGGYYSMPNLTTAEAVNFYAASLNYLAARFSSGKYGRIHHWIMHNEVDQGSTWTNMGEQPEMRYYDRYMKSMRLCYNIVRQYDRHASVLGSYTHTWNEEGNEYSPRRMLEQNVQYSKVEGDFRWGVAYHPYPIDLTSPTFWNDDRGRAVFNNDTRYVTLLNPEVINEWILNKAHRYKDGSKRVLVFSEQGTNSRSYSDRDLELQAAGAAWIWKKLERLKGVDAMQWHAWADSRGEFGLRIGLRAFEDGRFANLQAKPAWYVWQAAGTEREKAVFEPYLKVIGIGSWDDIMNKQ